ncbi:MAG TPA: ABC transporter substrate-binding protein [Candidatus Binatia bacterium]|nr:ABC transporter substrate-binding protein [Candidatus Binatia bacterium]
MNKKIALYLLITVLLATVSFAEAQGTPKVARIGFFVGGFAPAYASRIAAFRQGLHELGYVEGKNIVVEYRYGERKEERFPELAAELVHLKVDVIVTSSTSGVLAAKKATTTIPIVLAGVSDPVGTGLVASLARPGGNVTGLSLLAPELSGKRLELLKEAFPRISRVAVLQDPDNIANTLSFRETEAVAHALKVQVQSLAVQTPSDFEKAFSAITRGRADALITIRTPLTYSNLRGIVEFAAKNRLPAMYPDREFVDAGGLMTYGPVGEDLHRRAATYVDKILKGARPADLPVEQPMKFELVINMKTANQTGLAIPADVLARADKMIK